MAECLINTVNGQDHYPANLVSVSADVTFPHRESEFRRSFRRCRHGFSSASISYKKYFWVGYDSR